MIQFLQTGILNESLIQIEWGDYTESVVAIHRHLEGKKSEMTGWLNSPLEDNKENPFDLPGVEAYKNKMMELLK